MKLDDSSVAMVDRTGQVWTTEGTELVLLFLGSPRDRRADGLGVMHPAVLLDKGRTSSRENAPFEFQELSSPMEQWSSWRRLA